MNLINRSILIFILLNGFSLAHAKETFEFIANKFYSVSVFMAGDKAKNNVAEVLKNEPLPESGNSKLLMQSLDGATIIQICLHAASSD